MTCQCGCGQSTPLASKTDRRRGLVKGQPVRYLVGHQTRYHELPIRMEDTGFESPCWIWQAAVNNKGYPVRGDGAGGFVLVHRQQYEQRYGPAALPYLHHRCETPRCVNPEHMEPVDPFMHAARHKGTWGHGGGRKKRPTDGGGVAV